MKDEYIRKQDAIDAIHCDIKITGRENAETVCKTIESFTDGIKSLEPADVVQVVRCEDCKHHSFDAGYGNHWCNLTSGVRKVKRFDYCSYGKRKE